MAQVNANWSHRRPVAQAQADGVCVLRPKVVEADVLVHIAAIVENSEPKILMNKGQICLHRNAEL